MPYESFTTFLEKAGGRGPIATTEAYVDKNDGVTVWNPVHEPTRKHRWALFHYPKLKMVEGELADYKMFVYKASDDPEFYFFSNDVAWCLGYEDVLPHVAVQKYVPEENQKRIKYCSGILLTVRGVRDFIAVTPDGKDKDEFVEWFDRYLNFCVNNPVIDVTNDCPA